MEKIALFKFGGLGDYVCLIPFLEDLRKLYPRAEITAITSATARDILGHLGLIDRFVLSDALWEPALLNIGIIDALRDVLRMRRRLSPPYDLYIDLISKVSSRGWIKPWLFNRLCRPRRSVGLNCQGKGSYLDVPVAEDLLEHKHIIQRNGEIIRALGGESEFRVGNIAPPDSSLQFAERFFGENGAPGRLKIGLHPGANLRYYEKKAWPAERFAELADRLAGDYGAQIFLSGSPPEREVLERVKARARTPMTWIPDGGRLLDLGACIGKLDFFISNDTGPMHMAISMGVPTVGIFGAVEYATVAFGSYPESVPFLGIIREFTPAELSALPPHDPRGLRQITVPEVLEAFRYLHKKCREPAVARD